MSFSKAHIGIANKDRQIIIDMEKSYKRKMIDLATQWSEHAQGISIAVIPSKCSTEKKKDMNTVNINFGVAETVARLQRSKDVFSMLELMADRIGNESVTNDDAPEEKPFEED